MRNMMQMKKVILLRSAYRRGLGTFFRQLWMTVADILLRRKFLIFRIDARDVTKFDTSGLPVLDCREITRWDDMPDHLRVRLEDPAEGLEWGQKSWFGQNRRCWLGELDGQPACLMWWLNHTESEHFFYDVPEGAEILFQTVIFPEFRGRRLYYSLLSDLMRARMSNGIEAFYGSCHEYNTTPARNLSRLGFKYIGAVRESRLTGHRRWLPA